MATSNRAAKMHVSQFSAAALEGLVQRRFHATDLDGNVHPWTKDEIVLMLKEELVVVMRGCNPEITVAEASTLANDIMIHYDVDGSGTVELRRSVVNVAVPAGTTPAMVLAAGCINGAVSRTLTAPTDRLRAVLATGLYPNLSSAVRGIVREQGIVGLWNANTINVIRVTPENGIMFALNDLLKDKVCADPSRPTMSDKFLLGSVAGAASMSAVYPLYVVQSRMAAAPAGRYSGIADCMREVSHGGRGSLYAGYGTAIARSVPLKGLMLGGYSILKDMFQDKQTGQISTSTSLLCSAFAGGVAHAFTYPLHLARTVLQQPVPDGGRHFTGFVDVLQDRFRKQGIGGWYRGLPVWLLNRVPGVAIEFAVHERALDALRHGFGSDLASRR